MAVDELYIDLRLQWSLAHSTLRTFDNFDDAKKHTFATLGKS